MSIRWYGRIKILPLSYYYTKCILNTSNVLLSSEYVGWFIRGLSTNVPKCLCIIKWICSVTRGYSTNPSYQWMKCALNRTQAHTVMEGEKHSLKQINAVCLRILYHMITMGHQRPTVGLQSPEKWNFCKIIFTLY